MKKFLPSIAFVLVLGLAVFIGSAISSEIGFYVEGGNVKLGGPDYAWWYGCSPTSAGMMMAYYDRNGYGGHSYNNLVPGGTAESSTFAIPNNWNYLANNAIASWGYVTDFYRYSNGTPDYYTSGAGAYLNSNDDVKTPSHSFNCLADFMGTSQDAIGNPNGGTTFYYNIDGTRFYAKDAFTQGVWNKDGMYGMAEYFNYAGYGSHNLPNDTNFFTQKILKFSPLGIREGFTFADYKAEIDAGRVVMIQLQGHSVLGYGYKDDGLKRIVYLHDTWSEGDHTMDWGGSYSGMEQWGVTCFIPTGAAPIPPSVLLLGSGLVGIFGFRFIFKHKH